MHDRIHAGPARPTKEYAKQLSICPSKGMVTLAEKSLIYVLQGILSVGYFLGELEHTCMQLSRIMRT